MRPTQRPAFACCVAFAAALHLASLGAVVAAQRAHAREARGPRAAVSPLAVRMVMPAQAPSAAPAVPLEQRQPVRLPAGVVASVPMPMPESTPTPAQSELRPWLEAGPPAESDPVLAQAAGNDTAMEYVPRWLLTAPPVALGSPLVAFPDGVTGFFRLAARVDLCIDEHGEVNRIEPADPLPPAFAEAVHAAFLNARFSPGEIDGVAVRSRIRIEVSFESSPLDLAPPLADATL